MNPDRMLHLSHLRKLFLCLWCFRAAAVFAQPEPFYFREIPLSEQSRQIAAFCFETDENGLMWLGTVQGLLRFDGSTLTPPDDNDAAIGFVPPVRIQVMLRSKTQQHTFWLGTVGQGLCRFNPATQAAQNYRYEPGNPASLGGDAIAGFAEDADGTLWVGSDNFTLNKMAPGQSRFERITPPLPPGRHADNSDWLGEIIPDVKDPAVLWIGSRFGVYRFDKAKREFRLFPLEKTGDFWYVQHSIQLFMDGDGILWAGGLRTGLLRLDPTTGIWESWQRWRGEPDVANSNTVYEIQSLDADRLLIAVTREGLWWFDKKKKTLSWLPQSMPVWGFVQLPPGRKNAPRFLLSTKTGLTMMTAEPFLLPYFSFQKINPSLKGVNWQRSYQLSPGKDTLYMGTMHGDGLLLLDLKDNNVSALPFLENASSGTDVLCDELCLDDAGTLWLGTEAGLLFLNKETGSIEPFSVSESASLSFNNKHIQALAYRDGKLWVGTKNEGLFSIRLDDRRVVAETRLADNHIRKLYLDKQNRLWVGSDSGLWLYDGSGGVFLKITSVKGSVNDMEEDEAERLWVGTLGHGLQMLNLQRPEEKQLHLIPNEASLGSEVVFHLKVARDGRIWLHTQGGLAIFDQSTGYFINYDMHDRVSAKPGPLEELPNGFIVSAGRLGYYLLPPDFGKNAEGRLPKPYLKNLRLLGSGRPRSLDPTGNVELRHNKNQLAFELGAVWLDANPAVYYEYKLEGFDPEWVFADRRTFITFNNLNPGKYSFSFRVGSRPGQWSEPSESVAFVICPAFYQTLWFRGLLLLMLGGVLWGAYLLKLQRVLQEERMQAAFGRRLAEVRHDALRAQMNPHFLSNCLNSIQWFIIKNKSDEALAYLVKFSRLVRFALDHSHRQHIPLEEEVATLRLYLEMEAMRFEKQFESRLLVDDNLDQKNVQIPPMLLQPLVENAILHGFLPSERPGSLFVHITRTGDALTFTVQDNGIGRAAAALLRGNSAKGSPSQGLKLATERLSMLNGVTSLVFNDLFDEYGSPAGTKVVLTLPQEK